MAGTVNGRLPIRAAGAVVGWTAFTAVAGHLDDRTTEVLAAHGSPEGIQPRSDHRRDLLGRLLPVHTAPGIAGAATAFGSGADQPDLSDQLSCPKKSTPPFAILCGTSHPDLSWSP